MPLTTVISKRAANKLDKLLIYLETEWSIKVKIEFIHKLNRCISIISEFPESNEKSNTSIGLHKCVVSKQTTIFYRFSETTLNIVTIFDTRMNTSKKK